MAPRPRPAAERFWEKVEITEGCWLWTAALNAYGYCIHGHPFDAANTYHVDGRRRCRACSAARQREYAARRRALPTTQQGVAA